MALQPNPVYQAEHVLPKVMIPKAAKGDKKNASEDAVRELNEALMQMSVTEHGRHPYRYGIASVNFKGDTKGAGNANLRKLLLSQLQGQTHVSIVFVQECPWADATKQLQLENKFCYTGVTNEAGILWNSDLFEVERLDSYKLIGDKYPNLIQHRGRTCICKFMLKPEHEQHTASSNVALERTANVPNFIAISWHGPHKCIDAEKQLIFRDLLSFVQTLTDGRNGQTACIIGGDFNFSIDKAHKNIDNFPGLTVAASYGSETIDYFIFTSDMIDVLHAQQLSLNYDTGSVYTTQDRDRARAEACKTAANKIIDHSPIFAVLDLGSPSPFSSPRKSNAGQNSRK
ncbi:Hypp4346 [Branchiostoma lanceolatum]|uniref:Hypp4346 protein n=1 Tax=Branchiostoma lanceolatum TaxID=7740 RepID=A0A8K0ACY7_BRALA|nr:Hypp4346 [Branchiostoma lanceolatum]